MRIFLLSLLLICFTAAQGHAQTGLSEEAPEPPQVLDNMVQKGAQIYYLGEYDGMHGWVMIRQGKPEFFYENRDRTAVVMGLMFNAEGDMVTMAQLSELKRREGDDMFAATGGIVIDDPATPDVDESQQGAQNGSPDAESGQNTAAQQSQAAAQQNTKPATRAQRMYVDLATSNWITMNPNGAHDLFAFIDPDCPHCQRFIKNVQPLLTDDGLRVRIIPVGANDASLRRAALLLASGNPVERLERYVNGNSEALEAPQNINTEAVSQNVTKMIQYGFDVTPTLVYRTQGGDVRLIRGTPADYQGMVQDIQNN